MRSYFSLIWKQFCYSCLWCFNLWKVGTFLHITCHLKTLRIFTYLCFWAALLHSPSCVFFTSQSFSSMMLFDLISKVLFVNPSLKDSLTYFNFSILNKLMHHVNVPIWIPDHDLSTLLFVLKWSFIWRLCYSICFVFPWDPQGHTPFHCTGFYYFCTDLDGLCHNLRDVTSKNIFNGYASATTFKFCDWVLVEISLYKSTL